MATQRLAEYFKPPVLLRPANDNTPPSLGARVADLDQRAVAVSLLIASVVGSVIALGVAWVVI